MIRDTILNSTSNVYQEQEDNDFKPNEGVGTFTKDANKFIISKSSRVFNTNDINRSIIFNKGNYRNFILKIKHVINTMEVLVDDNSVEETIYNIPFKMLKKCGLHYEDGNISLNMNNGNVFINASKQEQTTFQLDTSSENSDISSIEIFHNSNGQINNKSINIIHQTGELQSSGVSIAHDINIDDLYSNDQAVVRAISVSTTNRSSCMKDGLIINEGFTYPFYIYSNSDKYIEPVIYLKYDVSLLFDTGFEYSYNKNNIVVKDGYAKLFGKESHLLAKFSFVDNLIDSISGITGTFVCGTCKFVNGKIEKCIEFNNNSYVKIIDNRFATLNGTVGCWINFYSVEGIQGIFRNGIVPEDSGYALFSNNGNLNCSWGINVYDTKYNILPNSWIHIVYTWNQNNITIYVNGEKILIKDKIESFSKNVIILGVNKGITNTKYNMKGLMDEFFVNDRDMSDNDIIGIYTFENDSKRLKHRKINEEQYIDTTAPIDLTSFINIKSYNIVCDKPPFTNILVYTSNDRINWKIFDKSTIDCKSNVFLRFGLLSNNVLHTPRIKSFTLISDFQKLTKYPIKLHRNSNDIIVGSVQKFNTIRIILENHKINTNKIEAYYWNNSWFPLNIIDNTSNFDRSGTIIFIPPNNWNCTDIIDSYKVSKLYYLRIVYKNKYKIQCNINKIEISITDYTKDFFINQDCSVHLPFVSNPKQLNSIYRDIEGRVMFYGNDNIKRSMTSFNVYSGEINGKVTSSEITRISQIDPSKVEEGFHITLKEKISGINYLCTVFDKKWKTIAFL